MTAWLVSAAVGGAFDYAPAVVVDADTEAEAARRGADALVEEDSGRYGVVCEHCEGFTIEQLLVVAVERTTLYSRAERWTAALLPVEELR